MIAAITCSTGAISRDPDLTDPELIVRNAKQIDCDGFELIFYPAFYDDLPTFRRQLRESTVRWTSLHTEKSIGPLLGTGDPDDRQLALERVRLNCELAADLGIRIAVLHLWGMPESDNNIGANIGALPDCLEIATRYGITLTVESIPCLNRTPLTHLRAIRDALPTAMFTLDTEFLAMHDELEAALDDPSLLERTMLVHFKDYDGRMEDENGNRRYLHPDDGDIDFAAVCRALEAAPNPISVCLESTSVGAGRSVDLDHVRRDLNVVRDLVNRAG